MDQALKIQPDSKQIPQTAATRSCPSYQALGRELLPMRHSQTHAYQSLSQFHGSQINRRKQIERDSACLNRRP